jgi:hypothetical protein
MHCQKENRATRGFLFERITMNPIPRQQDATHNTTDVYAQRRQLSRRVLELEALVEMLAGELDKSLPYLWLCFHQKSLIYDRSVLSRLNTALAKARGETQ